MLRSFRAVTLTELLITVVLVGIIAAFGIPTYNTARDKGVEKEALDNILLISDALELYKLRNGAFPSFNMAEVSDINTTLDLGIIEQNVDYYCHTGSGYTCGGNAAAGWNIHQSGGASGTIHCSAGNCPPWRPAGGYNYPKFME